MSINLLKEFKDQGYDLRKLKKYKNFLEECQQKDYSWQGTHKHHILPVFMKGSDKKENLIVLSYEDHFKAHLKLAECFPKGSKENWGNSSSSSQIFGSAKRLLRKKYGKEFDLNSIIFWKEAGTLLKDFYESPELSKYLSDNMKKAWQSEETRQKHVMAQTPELKLIQSQHAKKLWKENPKMQNSIQRGKDHPMYGKEGTFANKNHTEDTKNKMSESALKSWTEERKLKASITQSNRQKGKNKGFENNSAVAIIDTETNITYFTRMGLFKEFLETKLTDEIYKKYIASGRFIKTKKKDYKYGQ